MADLEAPITETPELAPAIRCFDSGYIRHTMWLLAACGLLLLLDLGDEIGRLAVTGGKPRRFADIVHVILELIGSAGLAIAILRIMRYDRHLRRLDADKDRMIETIRDGFDTVMQQRFREWRLTKAERDVALLVGRGLPIRDIALARRTCEGTVKVQMASIYRKANVNGRGGFMSLWIDELNMYGAQPEVSESQPG